MARTNVSAAQHQPAQPAQNSPAPPAPARGALAAASDDSCSLWAAALSACWLLPTPPLLLLLPAGDIAHVVVMPNIDINKLEEFVQDYISSRARMAIAAAKRIANEARAEEGGSEDGEGDC
jgi:hypothetical protein